MKKTKSKVWLLLATFVIFLIPLGNIAQADTATVNRAPAISKGQELSKDTKNKSNSTGDRLGATNKANSSQQRDSASNNAVKQKKEIQNKTQNDTNNIANQFQQSAYNSANMAAGDFTDYTIEGSSTGIMGIFERIDQLIDSVGGGFIGLLTKGLYYFSIVGIFLAGIMTVASIFMKKGKPWKWALTTLGMIVLLSVMMSFTEINIFNNSFTDMFKWLFTGK